MEDLNKMLKGMEEYFLSKEAITALIGHRLSRGLAEVRIVSQEKPEQTVATKLGRFAEYDTGGSERGKLLNAKSKFHLARVDFRFFGQFPSQAAEVYDAFYDSFGTTRLSTTWGDGEDWETKIMGAWWDDTTVNDDRDQTLGMAFMGVTLVVPFAVV